MKLVWIFTVLGIWLALKVLEMHGCPSVLGNVFYFCFLIYLFIHLFNFWLHWVLAAARGLSLVAVSGGYSLLRDAGFSLWWLLLLQSTGSRHAGFSSCGTRASVVVAHVL